MGYDIFSFIFRIRLPLETFGDDPLEEEMATHSSILAWEIPWTEKPGGLQSMGLQRVNTTEQLTLSLLLLYSFLSKVIN